MTIHKHIEALFSEYKVRVMTDVHLLEDALSLSEKENKELKESLIYSQEATELARSSVHAFVKETTQLKAELKHLKDILYGGARYPEGPWPLKPQESGWHTFDKSGWFTASLENTIHIGNPVIHIPSGAQCIVRNICMGWGLTNREIHGETSFYGKSLQTIIDREVNFKKIEEPNGK